MKTSWELGRISADFSQFIHILNLYMQKGFSGTMLLAPDIAHIKQSNPKATADEVNQAYLDILLELKKLAKQHNWPDYAIYSIDEPFCHQRHALVNRLYPIEKQSGHKIYTTIGANDLLEPACSLVDFKCMNNVYYSDMPTKAATEQLRKKVLDSGADFWWYGTGCYSRNGVMEDCNIIMNRFMLGLFHWRSYATGAWCWTFCRPVASQFNDFDGTDFWTKKDQ